MRSLVEEDQQISRANKVTETTIQQHSFFVKEISQKQNSTLTKNKLSHIFEVLFHWEDHFP
jgi:hypothetical protein